MNLNNILTTNEIKLLKDIEIDIENKEYSCEEIKSIESSTASYIMNQSTKNGDVNRLLSTYNSVLNKLYECE